MAWTRTFGQMKTDLGTWLGVDTDASNPNYVRLPEDVREFLILQARRRIALRRDLRFFEQEHVFDTGDGTFLYALPSDWGRPYVMFYVSSSTGKIVEVVNITRSKFLEKFSSDSTTQAAPTHYSTFKGNFTMAPTPDAEYKIYSDYFSEPDDFDDDADYDEFLVKGWDAIFFEACRKACAGYVMENTRQAFFTEEARRTLNEISGDHARAQYSGRGLQNEIPG